jgi:hypothetical protein
MLDLDGNGVVTFGASAAMLLVTVLALLCIAEPAMALRLLLVPHRAAAKPSVRPKKGASDA